MHTVVTDIYIRSRNISRVFTIHERNVNRGDESICARDKIDCPYVPRSARKLQPLE